MIFTNRTDRLYKRLQRNKEIDFAKIDKQFDSQDVRLNFKTSWLSVRAIRLAQSKDLVNAERLLLEAIELDITNPLIRTTLAQVYTAQDNYLRAILTLGYIGIDTIVDFTPDEKLRKNELEERLKESGKSTQFYFYQQYAYALLGVNDYHNGVKLLKKALKISSSPRSRKEIQSVRDAIKIGLDIQEEALEVPKEEAENLRKLLDELVKNRSEYEGGNK